MSETGRGILGNWDATSEEIAQAIGEEIVLPEDVREGQETVEKADPE